MANPPNDGDLDWGTTLNAYLAEQVASFDAAEAELAAQRATQTAQGVELAAQGVELGHALKGDSGWLYLDACLGPNVTDFGSRVRRVGPVCHFWVAVKVAGLVAYTDHALFTMPAGLTPSIRGQGANDVTLSNQDYLTSPPVLLQCRTPVLTLFPAEAVPTDNTNLRGMFSYLTDDAWPDPLPLTVWEQLTN